MKKVLDTFSEGQAPMYGWASEEGPTGVALIVVGAFLGVIVAKFFGM